ncbi:MAG: hypothetical protein RR961_10430 [Eubacterium sp.]
MIKEIGSEFINESNKEKSGLSFKKCLKYGVGNKEFYLSGRTALDAIIKDIKKTKKVNCAYLPEYCCDSMLSPFIENNIKVRFYGVNIIKGNLSFDSFKNDTNDIVYLMDYFGYASGQLAAIIKKNKGIIIQDCTHSFFQSDPYSEKAHYYYASLRKWTSIPAAALAVNQKDVFQIKPQKKNENYIFLRKEATRIKTEYITDQKKMKKDQFLTAFKKAEEMLDQDYMDYKADMESIQMIEHLDIENIRKKRIANASFLLEGLKKIEFVRPLFFRVKKGDCPLFVPILVDEEYRDKLQKYLVKKEIYVPIHWFLTELHQKIGVLNHKLYDCELSLICDQRYNKKDMKRILYELLSFEKKYVREV